MRYSMFIVSKDIMYNGTCAMELTRKHVVLSFISGGHGTPDIESKWYYTDAR
jgi:hypothetical protein